jgi:hypothetical protein
MTLTYTKNMHLAVPDFLTEPWHGEFAAAMDSIDQILYQAVVLQHASLWQNNHAYSIGDIVISPDNGQLYSAAEGHTSSATGTFTDELALHPSFWGSFVAISLASQVEAEAGVENTHYMSPLRTSQAIAALGGGGGGGGGGTASQPRSGILTWVSSTALKFTPHGGNKIKINGILFTIPNAGIAGLNNVGVFVNGVGGQNLAPSTTYLVFAANLSGVITADFRSTGSHRPSHGMGNEGTEVLFDVTDFDDFSLIGIVRTNGSAQFVDSITQRFVRSWFNDPGVNLSGHFTTPHTAGDVTYAEVDPEIRVEWVHWEDEVIDLHFNGPIADGGTPTYAETSIGIDSATDPQDTWNAMLTYGDSINIQTSVHLSAEPSEGYHFATLLARTTVAHTYQADADTPGSRPTLQGSIAKGW